MQMEQQKAKSQELYEQSIVSQKSYGLKVVGENHVYQPLKMEKIA